MSMFLFSCAFYLYYNIVFMRFLTELSTFMTFLSRVQTPNESPVSHKDAQDKKKNRKGLNGRKRNGHPKSKITFGSSETASVLLIL